MLPKIKLPTYFVHLIGTGKNHKIQPYTVKDQELLLMALEGKNKFEIIEACNNLIKSCSEDIDINKLPSFDFEMLFLKLRAISSGEVIELYIPHADNSECKHKQVVELNIDDIKFTLDEEHKKTIDLDDEIGVIMRYPSFFEVATLSMKEIIVECIESIYDKENVIESSSVTKEELSSWVEELQNKQLLLIRKFFETMPKVYLEINYTCSECGKEETRIIEGFENFFI